MALSGAQITALTSVQTARDPLDPLVWTMQQDLAQAAKLLVPTSVAHNRTKVIWRLGDKLTIFLSKDDSDRVNGFYFSWVGTEPIDLLRDQQNSLVGVIGCQYFYQFNFGSNDENSEKRFIANVSTFLVGLETLKDIQDKRFIGFSGDAILTESAQQPVHFWNGRLRFRICEL